MSTLLLVTDVIAACNTSSELVLKGRASSLSTTKMGLEVGHPLSRFPQLHKWVFTASAQLCTTQNWLLYSQVGEHYASKNNYTIDTPSTRQVFFFSFHTSTLLKLLVVGIRARAFIFNYKLSIWEYCFPEASRMCSYVLMLSFGFQLPFRNTPWFLFGLRKKEICCLPLTLLSNFLENRKWEVKMSLTNELKDPALYY